MKYQIIIGIGLYQTSNITTISMSKCYINNHDIYSSHFSIYHNVAEGKALDQFKAIYSVNSKNNMIKFIFYFLKNILKI
jgi:hypothetical protein